MKTQLLKPALLIIALATLILGQDAVSQFKIPLYVRDNGNNNANPVKRDTLIFGVHPDASYCIDPAIYFTNCDSIKESELPPPPPTGVFDSRFIDLDTRGEFPCVNGLRHNIRDYSGGAQIDTFQIQFQPGAGGYPFVFRWPTGLGQFCDSMRLKDGITGTILNANMLTVDSLRVTNTTIRQLKLYVYGAKSQSALGVPTLSLPANNATAVDTPVTFSWQPVTGAATYIFQLSTSPTFATFVRRDTLAGTSLLVRPLSYNTTYYWRVNANTAYLRGCFQTPAFQFSTISTCVAPANEIAPANGATNVATSPTLSWVASISPTVDSYEVQIASNSTFTQNVTTITGITTTSVVAGPFPNCVTRWWRVRTVCPAGTSPDWSPGRNFTVANAIPGVPVQLLPADNALNVSTSPTLTWSFLDSCSRGYRVQLALNDSTNIVIDDSVTTTSRSLSGLQESSDYFWRVRAGGAAGSSAYTSFRKFRTILNPPPAPSLLSPANADTTVPISAILRWSTSVRADSYQVQVATDAAFNSIVFNGSYITDTTQNVGPLASCTQYFWRARAKNAGGVGVFSSPVRNFRIASAPPVAPILTFPANGQDSIDGSPTLTWSPGDVCTNFYTLVVSLESDLSPSIVNVTTSATSRALSSLESNTTYYWQVTPIGNAGSGTPSAIFSFITTPFTPPPAPGLSSPANGQPDVPLPVTLCWDSAARASTYRLQVATDSVFSTLIFNDSTLTVRCRQLAFLLNNRTYFWRVNAKNTAGTSPYSTVYKFTTLSAPVAPSLLDPLNGATAVNALPQFLWSISTNAESYRFQLSKDSLFTQIIKDDSSIVVQSTQAGPLDSHTKYYWRVRGKNSAGSGPYSQVFSFTTDWIGVSNWRMWLNVRENGNAQETIFFGLDPGATAGIDPGLNEFELPPPDFLGTFDVRFVGPPLRPNSIGEGLRLNVLKFVNYTQVDTYKVKFQPGFGGYPITFSWSKSIAQEVCDSMVIMDEFGGATLRKRMDIDSTAVVTNTSLVSVLIIKYGAHPVLDVPQSPVELPKGFVLSQNYPNPFNPTTRIRFSTEQAAEIQLYVYDMLGRLVARLADRTYYPGEYSVVWNGTNDQGMPMPTGLYYARMTFMPVNPREAGGQAQHSLMRKMLMIK